MEDLIYYSNEKIREGIALAEKHFGRSFPIPKIEFNLRGRAAGRAHYSENLIRLNTHLFRENENEFIARTVPHELAHLIAYQVFGREGTGHGHNWRFVCRVLGMTDVTRCHHYKNVIPARIRKKMPRFAFLCNCATPHRVTSIKVKRMQQGTRYRCVRCNSPLRPI